MAKIIVKNQTIKTLSKNGADYICITDIARQKNPIEPKDVVKNWLRSKNTLEYLGLWEQLNNPNFKGFEFDPLLKEAGSNAFTTSLTGWVELTNAVGIVPLCEKRNSKIRKERQSPIYNYEKISNFVNTYI